MASTRRVKSYLDVKRSVEAHLEVPLFVLVEESQEALLEDRCGERIRKNNDTVGRIGQGLHLLQTDLVQATSEEIDDVSVVRHPGCQSLVELPSKC
jgi:hypothetical protein